VRWDKLTGQDKLLRELEDIRDGYQIDVKQFITFVKDRHLPFVDSLTEYAAWLDENHDGKHYSPATINRKIAAAKSRIRYAFKHSSSADSLSKKYQLEEVLKGVKLKRIDGFSVPMEKILSVEEVRKFIRETKDTTIRLMVRFLIGTGVRISEMLAIELSDLHPADKDFLTIRIVGKRGKERRVHAKTKFIESICSHFHGTTYLFEHHGRPFSRVSVTNRIKHESLKTIGREVTAHQLRHTWAVIQIQCGKDVSAVASALGHSDPGLTARMYADKTLKPDEAFLDIQESETTNKGRTEEKPSPKERRVL
jgi:integrase